MVLRPPPQALGPAEMTGATKRWGSRTIYCCGCQDEVTARLTFGTEIYPSRRDLADKPFWKCDACGNHVGCHNKTRKPTRPLGVIPTREISSARKAIHMVLDPLWMSGRYGRKELYALISGKLGWDYHTANIRSLDEATRVYRLIEEIADG